MTRSQATPCSSQLIWAEGRIAELEEQLAECQAREAKLREYIFMISTSSAYPEAIYKWSKEALVIPSDDTALREYRRKVLLEAADWFEEKVYDTEDGHLHSEYHAADELRKLAEE